MSTNCNKNTAPRNGTSRLNRLPKALDASFVAIDERSKASLYQFCDNLAAYINHYYFDGTEKKTDWQSVFNIGEIKEDGTSEPHLALFDSFLDLYAIAQKDLNQFTGKHLDYFFETVLGFEKKAAEPDKVYLIVELAKHISQYILNDKTEFKAGKNSKKQEQFYKLLSSFSFSHAQVASIKSILVDQTEKTKIYASPIANSGDGNGGELANQDGSWDTFGNESRSPANIGFAISSPLFRMAEGKRKITLTFSYRVPYLAALVIKPENFKASITAEKGWTTVDIIAVSFTSTSVLEIVLLADESKPKLVDYNQKLHVEDFRTAFPVLKIEILSNPNIYASLTFAAIDNVAIKTDVQGVKNLFVQNSLGKLDAAKPMEIFGPIPSIGANFYIGSNEVFQHDLSSLKLNFEYLGLPSVPFVTYYDLYTNLANSSNGRDATKYVNNSDYKAEVSFLLHRNWINATSAEVALFSAADTVAPNTKFSADLNIPDTFDADYNTEVNDAYNLETERGYLKLRFSKGTFGQADYQLVFSTAVIGKTTVPKLPNPPYLPLIQNLTIDYSCTATINLSVAGDVKSTYNNRIHRFYFIEPFGLAEAHPFTHGSVSLLPVKQNEGELYIGLSNSVVPQNLSLLLQVSEGSADPDFDKAIVTWAYLQDNIWKEFKNMEILREQTNGLLTIGIITLSIPKTVNTDNTVLPTGLLWLRASVINNAAAVCDIISITAQASETQFAVYDDVVPEKIAIEAGLITKLKEPDSAVKKVIQPYGSFDGKAMESGNEYYLRVSEILRHKRRSITLWDYERLILAQFSNVYTAKCINHTFYNGNVSSYNSLSPGQVTIIAVPDISISNAPNPLKPKVSKNTLEQIKTYLAKTNSVFAKLNVQNPIFEEIKLHFHLKLRDGYEENIYLPKLKTQLKSLLAPWTSNAATQMEFGGKIEKSTIIYQLEKLDYVDYITCVKMYLFRPVGLEDISTKDLETAETATAASILTAYPEHSIININDIPGINNPDCECADCNDNAITDSKFIPINECGCN
ncbi:baseplate J/gp47 family protein [Pedobacter borealis]|uniref:baseplate J/gp47 family protein n=1 Tax=Pedobacter borealis TaxID=475254 RepID=UPI000493B3EC|nr:baseplate J/gp47 family protein [Pedobacter borealis]